MDFDLGPTGAIRVVESVDCIAQSFVKGLLTRLGTSRLAPNYGTRMRDLLGAKLLGNVSVGLLSTMVESLIRFLIAEQRKYSQVEMSASEQLVGMSSLAVTFESQGLIQVEAQIKTRASEATINTSVEI